MFKCSFCWRTVRSINTCIRYKKGTQPRRATEAVGISSGAAPGDDKTGHGKNSKSRDKAGADIRRPYSTVRTLQEPWGVEASDRKGNIQASDRAKKTIVQRKAPIIFAIYQLK